MTAAGLLMFPNEDKHVEGLCCSSWVRNALNSTYLTALLQLPARHLCNLANMVFKPHDNKHWLKLHTCMCSKGEADCKLLRECRCAFQTFIAVQYILLAVTGWKESVGSAQVLQMEKLVSLLSPCCLKFLDIAVQKCQLPDAEVMATQNTSVKQYHDDCTGLPSSPQKR